MSVDAGLKIIRTSLGLITIERANSDHSNHVARDHGTSLNSA